MTLMHILSRLLLFLTLTVTVSALPQKGSHSSSRSSSSSKTSTTSKSSTKAAKSSLPKSSTVAKRSANGRIARSALAKQQFMKETGYPKGRKGYVVDHVVPLECGGADAPSNMQWQTVQEAK